MVVAFSLALVSTVQSVLVAASCLPHNVVTASVSLLHSIVVAVQNVELVPHSAPSMPSVFPLPHSSLVDITFQSIAYTKWVSPDNCSEEGSHFCQQM